VHVLALQRFGRGGWEHRSCPQSASEGLAAASRGEHQVDVPDELQASLAATPAQCVQVEAQPLRLGSLTGSAGHSGRQ